MPWTDIETVVLSISLSLSLCLLLSVSLFVYLSIYPSIPRYVQSVCRYTYIPVKYIYICVCVYTTCIHIGVIRCQHVVGWIGSLQAALGKSQSPNCKRHTAKSLKRIQVMDSISEDSRGPQKTVLYRICIYKIIYLYIYIYTYIHIH